jgi:hypothetical protein
MTATFSNNLGKELFNKHSKKYSQALDDNDKNIGNAG